MPLGPITSGVDHNHWERLALISAPFPNDAQVVLQFKGAVKELIFTHESGVTVEYSFNGNTVHGELDATNRKQLQFRRPASKIWFRAAGVASITVEGWALVY